MNKRRRNDEVCMPLKSLVCLMYRVLVLQLISKLPGIFDPQNYVIAISTGKLLFLIMVL